MNTIYTIGYSRLKRDDLVRVAQRLDLVVLDTRYSPKSRNGAWTNPSLPDTGFEGIASTHTLLELLMYIAKTIEKLKAQGYELVEFGEGDQDAPSEAGE